jgi:hypothetical protein
MTRWVNAANATAAAQNAFGMVTLADLNFASGTLYVHDGLGTLLFNGNSYIGLGQYGAMDAIIEDTTNTARTVALTLSGVEPGLVTSAMTENYQGRTVTLYIGPINVNTLQWIATPETVWEGRMDYMTIDIQESAATIKMNCEHRLFREPLIARYTDQDQQLAHPGDTFFNLLWQIPLSSANWGSVSVFHPKNVPPTRYPGSSPIHRPPPGHH